MIPAPWLRAFAAMYASPSSPQTFFAESRSSSTLRCGRRSPRCRSSHAHAMAKILVVDDNPATRELLAVLLRQRRHQIVVAADGAEALARVHDGHPDLVICDLLMPTMDGFEFVRRLRADPAIAATPTIFCSATFLEREARTLAESCGVTQVLIKPVDPDSFHRTVDEALTQRAVAPSLEDPRNFDREHLRLITDKLLDRDTRLDVASHRLA